MFAAQGPSPMPPVPWQLAQFSAKKRCPSGASGIDTWVQAMTKAANGIEK
jgi:hypothetical protein